MFSPNELGTLKKRAERADHDLEELAVVQAARGENRGGGDRGSNELKGFFGWEVAVNDSKVAIAETESGTGRTKIAGAIAGRSGLWQQDMLHCVRPGISWPQSMECLGLEGICE